MEWSAIKVEIERKEVELNILILKVAPGDPKVAELAKKKGLLVTQTTCQGN